MIDRTFLTYSQYHGSCCIGDTRGQGINSHGTYLDILEYSRLCTWMENVFGRKLEMHHAVLCIQNVWYVWQWKFRYAVFLNNFEHICDFLCHAVLYTNQLHQFSSALLYGHWGKTDLTVLKKQMIQIYCKLLCNHSKKMCIFHRINFI